MYLNAMTDDLYQKTIILCSIKDSKNYFVTKPANTCLLARDGYTCKPSHPNLIVVYRPALIALYMLLISPLINSYNVIAQSNSRLHSYCAFLVHYAGVCHGRVAALQG